MSVADILQSVEFLVDADGHKKAAVLDWPVWLEVTALLEELTDEQLWRSAFAASPDALAAMADEALADYRTGKTQPLIPDEL